jgi:apolipoprotein N-acyltransferase
MTALGCALVSAIGFYFSVGLGDQWWLAWLAPVPVLWLAFGDAKPWTVFFAAWAALALGATNILRAYAGSLPTFVLALAILAPSLTFAVSVMGARRVQRGLGSVAAMFAFAALWTMFDFLASFDRAGGTAASPAGAEVGAPILIQTAALVGYLGITFLLGAISAGIALGLRTRDPLPAGLALALFAANAGYGYWRMSTPPSGSIRVALVESDGAAGKVRIADRGATLKVVDAYAAEIAKLRGKNVQLIVLPEDISRVAPQWRREAEAKLAAAATATNATLVAGFNTNIDGAQRNVSWAFSPGKSEPVTYEKRRLVPVLESAIFTPGPGPRVLADGIGLEICKDMDFQGMIRADEVATKPLLLAVPAWDFDKDDWSHARVALLRSVENAVPMARSARDGLLTLNDRYGRLISVARTTAGFKTLVGELPLDGRGGNTLYDRIGDVFGWICLVVGIGLVAISIIGIPRAHNR